MRSLIIAIGLMLSFSSWANQTGIGISLGNPTGVNGKRWLDGNSAVDGGIGFALGSNSNFSIHSDYLLHSNGALFLNDVHPLDIYYGLGGRMMFGGDIHLGLRVPVGIAHRLADQTADTFFEIAPVFDFLTNHGTQLHVLLGARYYF